VGIEEDDTGDDGDGADVDETVDRRFKGELDERDAWSEADMGADC